MSLALNYLEEFEEQVPVTRKYLERVPEARLSWKPHEKSMTAGQLALHIARVPGGVARAVQQDTLALPDFRNPGPQPASVREILDALEESVKTVRSVLPQFDDDRMQAPFRLMQGEKELTTWRRAQFLRDVMLNHWYQHRGQFAVYLRLMDVAVPASWGPSADEPPNFVRSK
ncbi:MAG TPA: DinB family protein [Candidatus Acidoferrum sp.]|nr:DinB family protein [Candidatus Acidoferrum sp.]